MHAACGTGSLTSESWVTDRRSPRRRRSRCSVPGKQPEEGLSVNMEQASGKWLQAQGWSGEAPFTTLDLGSRCWKPGPPPCTRHSALCTCPAASAPRRLRTGPPRWWKYGVGERAHLWPLGILTEGGGARAEPTPGSSSPPPPSWAAGHQVSGGGGWEDGQGSPKESHSHCWRPGGPRVSAPRLHLTAQEEGHVCLPLIASCTSSPQLLPLGKQAWLGRCPERSPSRAGAAAPRSPPGSRVCTRWAGAVLCSELLSSV